MKKHKKNLMLKEEFWLDLRDKTVVSKIIGNWSFTDKYGKNLCGDWVSSASYHLFKMGINLNLKFMWTRAEDENILDKLGLDFHKFLEFDLEGKRYIADGTAGQIDNNYEKGFYGFYDNASDQLKQVYSSAKVYY